MKRQFLQFGRRQSLRRSLFSLATILGIAGSGIFVFNSGILDEVAFANDLTYQTSVPVEFTFNEVTTELSAVGRSPPFAQRTAALCGNVNVNEFV